MKERYRAKAARNKCNCCDDRSNNSLDVSDMNMQDFAKESSAYADDPLSKFSVQVLKDSQKSRQNRVKASLFVQGMSQDLPAKKI